MLRSIIFGLAATVCSAAYAACDVKDFMVQDHILYSADDVVRLSVLTEAEDLTNIQDRRTVDAAALVPGYFQGDYSDDERRSIVQRQYRMLQLDLTQISRRTIIQSHLSERSVDMYRACLEQIGLTLKPPAHAMEATEFGVYLQYNPGVGGGNAPMWAGDRPRIVVLGGTSTLPESYWWMIPPEIRPQEEIRFIVQRDLTAFTEVIANIGGRSESVVLPPQNPNRIDFQLKTASGVASAYAAKPHDQKLVCITAASGEVLFPETAQLYVNRALPPNNLNVATLLKDKGSEFEVCAHLKAQTYDDFTGGFIEATITVVSARVVPKTASVPARNMPGIAPELTVLRDRPSQF